MWRVETQQPFFSCSDRFTHWALRFPSTHLGGLEEPAAARDHEWVPLAHGLSLPFGTWLPGALHPPTGQHLLRCRACHAFSVHPLCDKARNPGLQTSTAGARKWPRSCGGQAASS